MTNYKTFKQLVVELSNIRTKEDLYTFCGNVDMSYQHDKITYQDNETLYDIVRYVAAKELRG